MKRLLIFLLILTFTISLASCGKKLESTETEEDNEKQTETDKSEDTAAESDSNSVDAVVKEDDGEGSDTEDDNGYTPLLYKVTDTDGSCVWVLGSIHVGYPGMIPLPEYITEAYYQSDALAVECDVLASEEDADIDSIMPFMYTDGTTIKDYISPELYEKAKDMLSESSYGYVSTYDYMKPIVWWELLEYSFYEKCSMTEDYGVDRNLLQMAKDEGKEILEIESSEFQLELQAGFSDELVLLMLESTVEAMSEENCEEYKAEFFSMFDAWYSGDEKTLAEQVATDTEGLTPHEIELVEDFDKQMIYDRNIGMADFAIEALESDNNVFICVGAAHVVGEDGIIDILSEEGYQIEICK